MKRMGSIMHRPVGMAFIMIVLAVFLLRTQSVVFAGQPQYQVTGVVTDGLGRPIEGVTISLTNSTISTLTDQKGAYTIRLVAARGELLFTAIGYLDKTLEVDAATEVNVSLNADDRQLDEIVVIGYGTVRKRDLTGSVTSVKSDDIVRSPAHNALEAIQGQVPGLDITRTSGSATAGVNMNIRGKRSLSTAKDEYGNSIANSPLVIIDGMQGGNISDINPQDIESIDVLKDASSTSIYGSQGANGVIIVTTKRGKSGKPRVNWNSYVGANGWAQYPEMRTGEDYIRLRREAAKTAGQWDEKSGDQTLFTAGEWEALQKNQWVNWKDEVFKNGILQSHQISISGGTDQTTGLLSGGYYREMGSFENDELNKFNLRLNVDHNIGSYVKVGTSSQLTRYDGRDRAENVLWRATTNVPLGAPYDENGNVILWPLGRDGKVSPLADEADAFTAQHRLANTNIIANGFLEIKPLAGLSFRSNFGANLFYNKNNDFESANSIDRAGEFPTSKASILTSDKSFISWDNIINYSFDIDGHSIALTALSSWTQSKFNSSYQEGTGQLVAEQLWHNIGANDKDSYVIRSNYVEHQTMSYAFRANYAFQGRYLLTLSNRWDGASRLSADNKWAMFPSVATAWRVSDESWFDVRAIDDFKIRASYGRTGNSGISPYGTQSGLTPYSNGAFQDQGYTYYAYNTLIGNKDLGWERSASWNLGVDLRMFTNRIDLSLDLYDTKTSDILLPRTLPTSMGSGNNTPFQIYQNIGSTRNRGVELVLNTKNIDKAFKWSSGFSFGTNKEKILDLIDGRDIIGGDTRETESLLIGRPLESFYTFKRLGIWQLNEAEEAATYFKDAAKTQAFKPGDIKLADLNGDHIIDNVNDVTYIGTTSPRWTLGFNNSFSYKSFDLNIYAIARWGQMMNYDFTAGYDSQGLGNQAAYLDYWTEDNPTNDFPRPNLTNFYNYLGYQTYNYIDGSYIKLKTVTLGYRLPKRIAESTKLNAARVYLSANNLFSWAKDPLVKNYDAERGGSAKSPLLRQFVLGINIDL